LRYPFPSPPSSMFSPSCSFPPESISLFLPGAGGVRPSDTSFKNTGSLFGSHPLILSPKTSDFNLVLAVVSFGGLIYLREHPNSSAARKNGWSWLLWSAGLLGGLDASGFFPWKLSQMVLQARGQDGKRLGGSSSGAKPPTRGWLKSVKPRRDIRYFHEGWIQLLVVLFWFCMDWCFTALTLYFCFNASGWNFP